MKTLLDRLGNGISDWYYFNFICSKIGHEYTTLKEPNEHGELVETNKKICITCHHIYEMEVKK
jgi:hypothetical protein